MPKTPTPPRPRPTPTPKRSTIKDVQAGIKAIKPVIAKQPRTPSPAEKIIGAVGKALKDGPILAPHIRILGKKAISSEPTATPKPTQVRVRTPPLAPRPSSGGGEMDKLYDKLHPLNKILKPFTPRPRVKRTRVPKK